MPIVNRIAALTDDMAAWRHDLHEHPELLYEVHRTAGIVADRLREFGQELQRIYAHNLALERKPSSSGEIDDSAAFDDNPDTFWMAPPHTYHATLTAQFAKAISFDRTVTMEWLNRGQNIESYEIQAWTPAKGWRTLHRGARIGHKKLIFSLRQRPAKSG